MCSQNGFFGIFFYRKTRGFKNIQRFRIVESGVLFNSPPSPTSTDDDLDQEVEKSFDQMPFANRVTAVTLPNRPGDNGHGGLPSSAISLLTKEG